MTATDVRPSGAATGAPPAVDARATTRATTRAAARPQLLALVGLVGAGWLGRIVWALRNGSSFDESFTAMMGRRPLGDLLSSLRASDSHPPLDYLLRAPLARAGAGELVLRAPSLLFSCAALALFAWWMRDRRLAGVVAVAVMAVSPFQIMYGGEARMYALLELLGVAGAILADAWLRDARRWHAFALGGIALVALFDHVSGFLLAAGLLACAGVRGDREAWRLRGAVATAITVWAVSWGPSFLVQSSTTHASWIGRTTLAAVVTTVANLVTGQDGVALVVMLLVLGGIARLWVTDRTLARVVVSCAVVPVAAAALLGLAAPFFIDRALTVAAWAPCLALGVVVDAVWRRSVVLGGFLGAVTAVLILPATVLFLCRHWEYDAVVDHLTAVSRAGDAVGTVPDWYSPLVEWRVGVQDFGGARSITVPEVPGSRAFVLGRASATGRVWMLWFAGDHRRFAGVPRCAPDWSDDVTSVSCLDLAVPR